MKNYLSPLSNKVMNLLGGMLPRNNIADLTKKYVITGLFLRFIRPIVIVMVISILMLLIMVSPLHAVLQLTMFIVILITIIFANLKYSKVIKEMLEKFIIRENLLFVIASNNLYESQIVDKGKRKKEVARTSARLSFDNSSPYILKVIGHCYGDQYSDTVRNLEGKLGAVFSMPLVEKKDYPSKTEYYFEKTKPKRRVLMNYANREYNKSSKIDLGYGIEYDPSRVPHILLQGGTGSGKSMFISFLILEFLKQGASVKIVDPKNSDLGSLEHYLGSENVVHAPSQIAKIVRETVEEMDKRYKYMRENFRYGANYQKHGFKPLWLVFDELGAFHASADKKTVNEVVDGLKRIILMGRQAGVFILVSAQQMNAQVLSTEMRDNLGLRIALGANSREGYSMVLGNINKEALLPLDEIGSGYLYMQGSGKESATYYETPLLQHDFDFIEALKIHI